MYIVTTVTPVGNRADDRLPGGTLSSATTPPALRVRRIRSGRAP